MSTPNRRAHRRVHYEAPILLAAEDAESYRESRLRNFSRNGMYVETADPIPTDSVVRVRMKEYAPGGYGPEAFQWYLAQVQWKQAIQRNGQNLFGLGARIMQRSHESLENISWSSTLSCDRCGDRRNRSDFQVDPDFLVFCQDCDEELDVLPDGSLKQSMLRFLKGNVL